MHRTLSPLRIGLLAIAAAAIAAVSHFFTGDATGGLLLASAGALDFDAVMKGLDSVEKQLKSFGEKADAEMKNLGKVTGDTKTAIDNLGTEQRALADRLLALEQKGAAPAVETKVDDSWGAQFIKGCSHEERAALANSQRKQVSFTVKNTVSNTVGNTFSDRQPGIVGGSFRMFTLEELLSHLPTSSNAVDYVRENVFTNAAAETAEAGALPESSVTTAMVTEPVATIGHWLKISRQLAADNAALAAYINTRLRYGVNLRVENQIMAGNGVAPNMSGFTKSGNFTAHGYTAASLTAAGLLNNRFDLIGKMIGDCAGADYPADAIVLNPADWWTMRLAKDSQGRYILGDPGSVVPPSLFGLPVVASNAITVDNVMVGAMRLAATFYDREDVQVDMSEHDSDNFQRLLITLRATRRCMLAVERPAAIRYGDLTPA